MCSLLSSARLVKPAKSNRPSHVRQLSHYEQPANTVLSLVADTTSLETHTPVQMVSGVVSALPSPNEARAAWAAQHPVPAWLDVPGLARLLDHDNFEMREELRAFLAHPLFAPDRSRGLPLNELRELALERLQLLCPPGVPGGKFLSVLDFKKDPRRVFATHELVGLADGALATKMTVQWNLAGGTVLKLGTKRHHDEYIARMDGLEMIGCFALTELAWGNNAVMMETTAVYDRDTSEFVINTPNAAAQK
jgi:acyl-CoA oxidase